MPAQLFSIGGQELQGPTEAQSLGVSAGERLQQTSDLFEKLKRQFLRDAEASDKWRRDARSWYATRDGDQWDSKTLAMLEEQGRPALTFNRVNSIINVVCGLQISNRQDVYVYPRSEGDAEVTEIGTEGIRWFDDRCQADSEESRAFRDALTCGVGVTETRMDYLDEPEGKGWRERVCPLSVFWDASASKRNLSDAKRVFRVKVMELEEAMELFPDIDAADFDAAWTGLDIDGLVTQVDRGKRDYRESNAYDKPDYTKPVRMVQAQWWEREYQNFVTLPDGQEIEVESPDLRLYRGFDVQITRIPVKRYYYAIIGASVLQTGPLDPGRGFTFKFITGQYDEKNGCWYGLVKPMTDPQLWQNKTLSNIVHILSTMGKGGLLYESDAFVDPEKAKRDWSSPNAAIEVEPGALGGGPNGAPPKFSDKPTGQLPAGLDALLDFSERSISRCAGVPFELLVQDVSDQLSGIQEFERRRTGMNALADYFDSMRLYQIQQAELTFEFLRVFHADHLIRIVAEDQQKYVRFALDPEVQAYDFVIDDSPASPNQKERDWQLMLPLIQVLVNLPTPPEVWAEVLRASPISERRINKIIEAFAGSEEETPEEQQQRELLLRQAMAQIVKTESEALENQAQAQKAGTAAHLDLAKAADLGFRQRLDAMSEFNEIDVQRRAGPERTTVVDIQ